MVEVELDLLDQLLRQISKGFVGVAVVTVVGGDADDFVVHFAVIDKLHHTDDARFQEDACRQGLFGNQQYVQFVAILVQGLRDEAVVGRFGENRGFDAVKLECAEAAVPFDFVVTSAVQTSVK